MLQAPIEGYEDAIVVPQINANNFELKQTLINLVQSNQFTGRQDPHNHLRFFNKVTSTFRHPEVPNTTIKLLLFPLSLEGEARIWLDKEPSRLILTGEDLVSKFINQFFPPSKTTYLWNEITNFSQKSNETFNEVWEHFKDLLRKCPHHGFSELHQLDIFYNALNSNDQDALDSTAGRNFLDKIPRRPFLSTAHAIINVHEREIILRQDQQSLTIQCSDIPSIKKVKEINKIDFINAGGIDFDSEEIENFLNDDSILFGVEDSLFNMEEDILFLESLLKEDSFRNPLIIPNQKKSPIEEPKHLFNMGFEHFNTNLITNNVAESIFTTISNPLFDNDTINSDEINSHVESNSDKSTSNHDIVKFDNLDEFSRPLIPIHILKEERIRREHADYINRMEMMFTINPHPHHSTYANTNVESFFLLPNPIQDSDPHQEEIDVVTITDDVLPPSVDNDDSDGEVDAVDDLRVDNSIQNSEHEFSESEDSDFDNPSILLPPSEPPDEEFNFKVDFGNKILVVRNTTIKFECIDARIVFNEENDDLSYFMFVIFDKMFSLLSVESEDTIFDPGISD
nr:reverse transcriptase domain-containing protein [Tanacetum cinerariifolium]